MEGGEKIWTTFDERDRSERLSFADTDWPVADASPQRLRFAAIPVLAIEPPHLGNKARAVGNHPGALLFPVRAEEKSTLNSNGDAFAREIAQLGDGGNFTARRHLERWPTLPFARLFFVRQGIGFRDSLRWRLLWLRFAAVAAWREFSHRRALVDTTQAHMKINDAPGSTTTEATEDLLLGVDGKAWRALFVQPAEHFPFAPSATRFPAARFAISE